jgi:hypothetical protein
MPRMTAAATLTKLITDLRNQRQVHAAALAEIDATFAELGIAPERPAALTKPAAAEPAAPKGKRRRKRGVFKENADQFILGLLKGKSMTTSQVNAAWKEAGRGGSADHALGNLIKAGQIKKAKVKNGKGSSYGLA